PHAHALLYGVPSHRSPSEAAGIWEHISRGFARIKLYVPQGGAASYVAKSVRTGAELLLLGPWPQCAVPGLTPPSTESDDHVSKPMTEENGERRLIEARATGDGRRAQAVIYARVSSKEQERDGF